MEKISIIKRIKWFIMRLFNKGLIDPEDPGQQPALNEENDGRKD